MITKTELDKLVENYDLIMLPASGDIAPKLDSANDEKLSDTYLIAENHLVLGNFAGLPSITIPCGMVDDMPIGVNFMGRAFEEQEVLNMAYALESKLSFKNMIAKGGK